MATRRKPKETKVKGRSKRGKSRRLSLKLGGILFVVLVLWGLLGEWFVHHPQVWVNEQCASLPDFMTAPLLWMGNPLADLTDALDLTGYDTVCEYDTEAPSGEVLFAGAPVRVDSPAPADIRILERGEFLIGWSDTLRHPVWCAYHVKPEPRYDCGERPSFLKDRSQPRSPAPDDYTKSGYDRGHMVPNYAIVTRYGAEEQRKTFLMSNIAPQTPALNRGVWREFEHRIADLWTSRYGEIWVVIGCISDETDRETLSGTDIDVPTAYYQVIIAQEDMDVRSLAVLFRQDVPWNAWAARHIVTIDELEKLTGLDFNPDLPSFIQEPLESDLPSRLWPIRKLDIFRQLAVRFM